MVRTKYENLVYLPSMQRYRFTKIKNGIKILLHSICVEHGTKEGDEAAADTFRRANLECIAKGVQPSKIKLGFESKEHIKVKKKPSNIAKKAKSELNQLKRKFRAQLKRLANDPESEVKTRLYVNLLKQKAMEAYDELEKTIVQRKVKTEPVPPPKPSPPKTHSLLNFDEDEEPKDANSSNDTEMGTEKTCEEILLGSSRNLNDMSIPSPLDINDTMTHPLPTSAHNTNPSLQYQAAMNYGSDLSKHDLAMVQAQAHAQALKQIKINQYNNFLRQNYGVQLSPAYFRAAYHPYQRHL